MLHEPHCYKCQGIIRLVAYRRNDGNPEWTCAQCAGLAADSYRVLNFLRALGPFPSSVLVVAEAPERTPRRSPAERYERSDHSMKPKYMGPRAAHDPLR